ncbi:lantibiotic dehydratase, partial [Streptomyces sp. PGLac3x]
MPVPDAPGPRPGRPRDAFVLRTAGRPGETVRPLRAPGARRWADDVLDAAARLTADGEALGDLLHPLIGGLEDEAERRALLKLRREVFNNRLPKDPEAARALVAARDPRTAEALTGWLERRAALAAREAEGAGLLASETAR